jgi:hypothetical protein
LLLHGFRPASKVEDKLNYKLHAMFIYHFTKYINWPQNKSRNEFNIGVIGNSPITIELQQLLRDKLINNKKVVVKSEFLKRLSPENYDIIFLSAEESGNLSLLDEVTNGFPVLIITEQDGMLKKGSMINFLVKEEKLRFEISKTKMLSRNLNVSNELLKLATKIQ